MEPAFRSSLESCISEASCFVSFFFFLKKNTTKGIIPVNTVLAGISASLLTKGLTNTAQQSVTDTKALKLPESGLV